MTGWGVERDKRTASRSGITHGGSSLMPSHSQGAERRTERRAGRTGIRWGLRALVIGGLAGAAWLLTGSAANAAGDQGDPLRSTLDDVATVTGYEPAVDELLEAADQPLEPVPTILGRQAVQTALETAPETLDEIVHDGSAIDATTVGALPRPATGSSRTSGGTTGDRALPEPSETVAEPVNEAPEKPATTAPEADRPGEPAVTRTRAVWKADRERAGVTPARKVQAQPRQQVHRNIPAARPAPETVRPDVPEAPTASPD